MIIQKFLNKKQNKVKFLDGNFCVGGCISGPCLSQKISLRKKKKRLLQYFELAKHEKIPKLERGIFKRAEGISFYQE